MKPFFPLFVAAVLCHTISFARNETPTTTKNSPGFRENKGQLTDQYENKRKDILYYGSSNEMSYYLKKDGLSYQLYKKAEHSDEMTIQRVDITWLGANTGVTTEAQIATGGLEHFYNTPDGKEVLNVKAFETILYKNIYSGIDAKYYHQNGSLKYDFIVKPYANYRKIAFKIEGAERLSLNADGTITISTPLGNITEGKPIAYQEGKPVDVRWVLENNVLSFAVAGYDAGKELVIDPLVYAWEKGLGSYPGGGAGGAVTAVINSLVTDAWGNVYTGGLYDYIPNLGNPATIYLVKNDSSGALLWSYTGTGGPNFPNYGAIYDVATFVTNVYIGGMTSTSNIATTGAHQVIYGGVYDGFLEKLDSSGLSIWRTYYGGSSGDIVNTVSLDSNGNVIIAGNTASSNNIATINAYKSTYSGGSSDGFVAMFDTNGVRRWGTYFGDTGSDMINGSAVKNNQILIAGTTTSNSNIATTNSHQSSFIGTNVNGFIATFDTLGAIAWSSYYGGDSTFIEDCTYDNSGDILITGSTKSNTNISTPLAFQTTKNADVDGFVAKFNDIGTIVWGTYYGDVGSDYLHTIALSNNEIIIGGATNSTTNIATPYSYNPTYLSTYNAYTTYTNAFFVSLDFNGQRNFGSYVNIARQCNSVAVDQMGNVFLAGYRNQCYVCPLSYLLKLRYCNAPKPMLVVNNLAFCLGDSVLLSTTIPSGYNFQWYKNDTAINGATNATYYAKSSGSYYVVLDDCPNGHSDTIIISTSNISTSVSKTDAPCVGVSLASITIHPSGGILPYSYAWDNFNDTTHLLSNLAIGTYVFHVTDSIGCVKSDTVHIQQAYTEQPHNAITTKNVPCYGAPLGYISLNTTNGHPPYSYTWENLPDTTATITQLGVGTYVVHTTDSLHCLQTDSITISQETTTASSSPLAEICAVTVDSATGKNLIIWEKQGDVRAASYNLYTEGTTEGHYNLIGNNSVNQFSTYLDNNSNPQQRSYLYKISEVDSCNHENPLSTAHKTIHLAANVGLNGQINLNWNPYEGKPYSSHYIMRSVNFGPFVLLNQVASGITSYSDLTPPNGIKVYRIDIDLPTTCNPAKSTAVAHISSNNVRLIDASYLQIVPNPTTDLITIIGARPKTVRVFDAVGKMLMEKTDVDQLQLGELPSAVYLIKLYNENGKLYHQQKIVKR